MPNAKNLTIFTRVFPGIMESKAMETTDWAELHDLHFHRADGSEWQAPNWHIIE